ncbi:MAG: mechanosensitive ion channel family protein [Planctomycetota bacterium]|nr:mechanosensitive ion channel family protein [Planctomycetota bacterium]
MTALRASRWFSDASVRVENAIVFLDGEAQTEEARAWASEVARSRPGVLGVVNRMDVASPDAMEGLRQLRRDVLRALPTLGFALLIVGVAAAGAWAGTRGVRRLLHPRIRAPLLRDLIARAVGVLILLAGVYVVLRVSGLTQLALTVVGGTGLVGLALGIAFRDIVENYFASILLSVHRPFETGDLIEVAGVTGYVQQLNVRTTMVMTLDGNFVQLPNSVVYKSTLSNFTANRNRRESFVVGIGYDDPIDRAQEVALRVLNDHPAVLDDPEPWVLADNLGAATVNIRVYFWLNGHEHSWLKVRSSVIRLVKRAFQEQGISMPDEAREVVFPHGVPVVLHDDRRTTDADDLAPSGPAAGRSRATSADTASTRAEGGLTSEAAVLGEQARQAKPLHDSTDLLSPHAGGPPA